MLIITVEISNQGIQKSSWARWKRPRYIQMVIMLVEISKKFISMNTKKFLSALKETE